MQWPTYFGRERPDGLIQFFVASYLIQTRICEIAALLTNQLDGRGLQVL